MDDPRENCFKTGQLVCFKGKPTRPHVNIWSGPAFNKKDEDPIRPVNVGNLALVIEVYLFNSKILVDGIVGWVENWDIDPL